MATSFDDVVGRTPADNRTARERPERVLQLIKDVEKTSLALRLGNVTRMSTFQERFRVANTLPDAKWLNGTTTAGDAPYGSANTDDTDQNSKDSALKQTTNMTWANIYRTPEELAIMVPMPDAWRDDSDVAWEEVREALRTAFSKAIDAAIFFGVSTTSHPLPSSFGAGVIADAIAAGNEVAEDDTGVGDLADAYAATMQGLERRGFRATRGIVDLAETWRLRRLRSAGPEAFPIYTPSLSVEGPSAIYGRPLEESDNGTWDTSVATALFGDYSHLRIGVRQEMTFKMFDQGVITDAAGNVTYNAMEQDGEILRAVMRLGYVVTDPFMHQTGQREFPFHVLRPSAS